MADDEANTPPDDGKRKRLSITRRAHGGQMTKLINKGAIMIQVGLHVTNRENLEILILLNKPL